MPDKINWYKINYRDGSKDGYTYVGSSGESLEELARKAVSGDYIKLDNLLYKDNGEIFNWEQWDSSVIPSVVLNPRYVLSIMQFKDDPRKYP